MPVIAMSDRQVAEATRVLRAESARLRVMAQKAHDKGDRRTEVRALDEARDLDLIAQAMERPRHPMKADASAA